MTRLPYDGSQWISAMSRRRLNGWENYPLCNINPRIGRNGFHHGWTLLPNSATTVPPMTGQINFPFLTSKGVRAASVRATSATYSCSFASSRLRAISISRSFPLLSLCRSSVSIPPVPAGASAVPDAPVRAVLRALWRFVLSFPVLPVLLFPCGHVPARLMLQ